MAKPKIIPKPNKQDQRTVIEDFASLLFFYFVDPILIMSYNLSVIMIIFPCLTVFFIGSFI